ncbi:CHAT domain-containing protein [Streptomyces sp. NPDC002611]
MTPVYVVCLVLAAAPALPNAPNVLEEHRDIQQSITHSRYGHTLRLDTLPAARWDDLAQYLADTTPQVLHFAGRGTPDSGPRFVTDDGGEAPVALDGLRRCVTAATANGLHLLVLNACWTAHLAKEFSDAVPAVIGWQAEVADVHARGYARVFHRNLAAGESVAKAHGTARMMLDLAGCTSLPTLHTGDGRIPEAHFLIGPEARSVPRREPLSLRYQQSGAHLRKPRFRPPPPQF